MITLNFEEIADYINDKNIDGLKRFTVENYAEMGAYKLYEFMCADFECNVESEYKNDTNVTPEMVEKYAKQLQGMQ